MSQSRDDMPDASAIAPQISTPLPYESPLLTPVGNARDLLALTLGPSADGDPEAQGQQN